MDKVDIAIMRLREASQMSQQIYGKPLVVTTSGGKDSSVCVSLAEKAGMQFEVLHNHTSVDAPETYYHIESEFNRLESKGIKCTREYPIYSGERVSMFSLIPMRSMPPTRLARYCCSILKERGGANRFIVTGIRRSESVARKENRGIYEASREIILNNDNDDKRKLFEHCGRKSKHVCNPIIDWSERDVWDYIREEKLAVNPLYDCGYNRVGCIGCPMAGTVDRQKAFARYPKYKNNYILAFKRMLEERDKKGLKSNWKGAYEVFHWWMEDGVLLGQINLFEEDEE